MISFSSLSLRSQLLYLRLLFTALNTTVLDRLFSIYPNRTPHDTWGKSPTPTFSVKLRYTIHFVSVGGVSLSKMAVTRVNAEASQCVFEFLHAELVTYMLGRPKTDKVPPNYGIKFVL